MENLTVIFPILAASSVIILIIIKVYIKIREFFPVSVNCWFCNSDSKVAYNHFNSWTCPKCDQYNGFLQDGGYNKIITAQHDEYLNIPSLSTPRVRYNRQSPSLCQSCNINQQLKVAQLASFVPLDPNNFDNEVDNFSQQLEKVYDVCSNCQKRISSLFKKEKNKFSQCYDKENSATELNSTPLKKRTKRIKDKLIYYGVILGCTPQIFDAVLRYDSVKNFCLFVYKDYMMNLQVPDAVKDFIDYKHTLIRIGEQYNRNYTSFNFGCIGLCVLVYFVGTVRSRTMLNVLNLTAWCIMFSLKYFSAYDSEAVVSLQGVTAAVFLVLNKRNNTAVTDIKKKKRNVMSVGGKKATVGNVQRSPKQESHQGKVFQSTNSAFASLQKSRVSVKDVRCQNLTEECNLSPKSVEPSSPRKNENDDLGISSLHLGMRKRKPVKNHLTTEPRRYYDRSNDMIWNRTSVLSPSRLNVDDQFLNQTRCSSQTSGVSSLSSTPQPHDTSINDRDFDCFSDTPMNSPNRMMSYYPSYDQLYQQQLAVSPYAYYQFAAMFHRMYTPASSSFGSESSGDRTLVNNVHQCRHDRFYILLISLVIVCNFLLIGLVFYKEFFMSKV